MRECSRRDWGQHYLLDHFQACLSHLPVFKFLKGLVHRQFPALHFLLQEDEFVLPSSQAAPRSGKALALRPRSLCNVRGGCFNKRSVYDTGKKKL